jgi:hypothetical protein
MLKRLAPAVVGLLTLPAAAAHLSYHNGRLLTAPRYVNVFWGSYWNGRSDVGALDRFAAYMAHSPDYDSAMQEYAVPGYPIRPGSFDGGFVIASDPGSSVDDPAVRALLDRQINSGALPARTDDRVYIVLIPPGVSFSFGPGGIGGEPGGYHTVNQLSSTGGLVHYIVVPQASAQSTDVVSHEMAETVTDPDALDLSRGWYDDSKSALGAFVGEIGDLCESQGAWVGGYWVATLWSNVQNGCVTRGLAPSPGGGCPAGTTDQGGVCVPDNVPLGCSSGAAPWFAIFGLAVAARFRRGSARTGASAA